MCDLQMLMGQARQYGVRMTRQRAIVLQALCELGGHASAEAVYEQATLHRRDVDLSTVYRTLERLRDLRILSQTDLGRGHAEYEVVADQPHHHLICQGCGQVMDLDHTYLATAAKIIRRDYGFEPIFDHFAIFGWCRECKSGGDGPRRKGED
jgi:Fur family ferric uptake transcriptional regulator